MKASTTRALKRLGYPRRGFKVEYWKKRRKRDEPPEDVEDEYLEMVNRWLAVIDMDDVKEDEIERRWVQPAGQEGKPLSRAQFDAIAQALRARRATRTVKVHVWRKSGRLLAWRVVGE